MILEQILFLLLFYSPYSFGQSLDQCSFPESRIRPFYFELPSDATPGTIVVDTTFEPPDARPTLASIRSDNLPETPFSERFVLEIPTPGRLILRTVTSIALPAYPSPINRTNLFMTVVCNELAFPLMTVRITAINAMSPQFYHEPYTLKIDKDTPVGTIVDTPVTSVDWDPSNVYPVTFKIEGSSPFEVAVEPSRKVQMSLEGSGDWPLEQMISVLRLKLVAPLTELPLAVRVVAYDNGLPPRTSSTIIQVEEYTTLSVQQNNQVQQEGGDERRENHQSTQKKVTKQKHEIRAHASKIQNALPTIDNFDAGDLRETRREELAPLRRANEEGGKSRRREPKMKQRLELPKAANEDDDSSGGIQDELLTRFKHCTVRVSIPENSPKGTFITRLEILNRKKDTRLMLLDPDGTFTLDPQNGDVRIADNHFIDREMFSSLEVVAEIEGSSPSTMCARTRLKVDIQDLNDNRPTFEKEKYWIHLNRNFPVGREVITLVARDIDDGANGQITYRLLTEDVPFQVGTKGKDCVLTTTADISGEDEYHLEVEARDGGQPERRAVVEVDVYILKGRRKTNAKLDKRNKTLNAVVRGVSNTDNDIEPISTTSESPLPEQVVELTTTQTRTTRRQLKVEEKARVHERPNSIEELDNESVGSKEETFVFSQPTYYYEALGDVKENDLLGRVVAEGAEFFAIERKYANFVKVDETGELLAARGIVEQPAGNHSIKVSATNGFETTSAIVTLAVDRDRRKEESRPQFDQSIYKFRTLENEPPQVLGYVRAFHPSVSSSSSFSQLTYTILSADSNLPFAVDPLSGEIIAKTSLDYEKQNSYNFKVRACLSTYATSCGLSTVLITIDDVNDNAPKFTEKLFQTAVPSDLPVGSQIYQMHATDKDSGQNGRITYAITPPSAIFAVDVDTGRVLSLQPLSQSFYSILVEAFDNGVPRKTDIAELRIAVHGTNPSAPVFEKDLYDVMLTGPVRPGQVVAEVRATDPDPGLEGQVVYRLSDATNNASVRETFFINEKSGAISALRLLTEKDAPVELRVEATDGSTSIPRTALTKVKLEILGDDSLRFLPLPTTVFISTEKPIGSVVIRASASTRNKQPVHFRVLEEHSPFTMDGDLLRVASHLQEGISTLTIRAQSGDSQVDHQLRVVVMADRDKYPVFPQLTYDIDIARNSRFPLIVHRFEASLLNGTMQYSFFPRKSQPPGLFIDERTGDLTATADFVKDKQTGETTFIVIRAINMNYPTFYSDVGVAVTVTENQSPLRFSLPVYRLEVPENTPVGTLVGQLQVLNVAAPVVFSILPNSILGVNPNGSIFIQNNIDLEALPVDNAQLLNFVVTAESNGDKATARIQAHIGDVNEFRPQFKEQQIQLKLRPGATTGSVLGKVEAFDGDRSERQLNYRIVGGTGKDFVFIQEDGTIILAERKPGQSPLKSFDLFIEAVDRNGNKDQMTVFVEVEAINDHVPRFDDPNITWNITKTTINQFFIHATDEDEGRNGRVQMRIVAGNEEGHFELVTLNGNNGRLQVVKPFNASIARTFILTVEARDSGDPALFSLAPVTINVVGSGTTTSSLPITTQPTSPTPSITINHPPVFTEQAYSINLRPGDGPGLANIVAQDPDGDVVSYAIEPPEYRNLFSIDSHGRLSLRVPPESLQQPLYSFLVIAEDSGSPIMSAYVNVKLHILQPHTESTVVAQTSQTTEPTQRPATIQIVEGDSHLSTSSKITKPRPSPTTGQTTPPTTTTSQQDIRFTSQEYRFTTRSDASFGSIVGQVALTALPPGQPVDYSFVSTSRLSLDADGTIRTAQNMAGDEEIDDIVLATQEGRIVAEARILVYVEQLSTIGRTSSQPQTTAPPTRTRPSSPSIQSISPTPTSSTPFAFRRSIYFGFVPEGNYSQGGAIDLKPEPLSTNYAGRVTYEIANRDVPMPFFLTDDGQLIVFDADREKQANFMFDIIAKKDGRADETARATINITILDVNDNPPQFSTHKPSIGISKDLAIGSVVAQLKATDLDADVNGQIRYELEGADNYLKIDEEGTIRVVSPLISAPDEMELTVKATDGGRSPKTTQTKITLRLFDPLMPAPHLPKEVPEIVVAKGVKPDTVIGALSSGPESSDLPTTYTVSDDLFTINKQGELSLTRMPTDNEVNRYHQLNVTATNRYGNDWTSVNVFVEGNQRQHTVQPQGHCAFEEKVYNVNVRENEKQRRRLTKVTSNCEREHRQYKYRMDPVEAEFEIDETSGEVWVIRPLDREKQAVYMLYVTVDEQQALVRVVRQNEASIQQAAASLRPSQCLVVVRVIDVNDNGPKFMHLNADGAIVGNVAYNSDPLTAVARLQARDPDSTSQLKYSLSGEDAESFMVNEETGVVMLAKSIDASEQMEFRLTARATDGTHNVEAPFVIYKLSPDTNLVQLTGEMPASDVNEEQLGRALSDLTQSEAAVLVKQPYIDTSGKADPNKSLIYVYATNPQTQRPYGREELQRMLESHSQQLRSQYGVSSISLLSSPNALSAHSLLLLLIAIIAVAIILLSVCLLILCFKRRDTAGAKRLSEGDYMVDSIGAGPRPYDVESITRQTAQKVLAGRPLPEPLTEQVEVAISPAFMDRSESSREFSNSVLERRPSNERPSLLQSALQRQKVHAVELNARDKDREKSPSPL